MATYQVGAAVDEVSQYSYNSHFHTGGTSFGNHNIGSSMGYTRQGACLRFTNINIPKNSIITSCYITVVAPTHIYNTVNVGWNFEASDNPNAPTSYADAIARSLTSGVSQTWGNQTSLYSYSSPSLNTPCQEIVNRPGWNPGNAMTVFCRDAGSANGSEKSPYSWTSGTYAPKLTITWGDPPWGYKVYGISNYKNICGISKSTIKKINRT